MDYFNSDSTLGDEFSQLGEIPLTGKGLDIPANDSHNHPVDFVQPATVSDQTPSSMSDPSLPPASSSFDYFGSSDVGADDPFAFASNPSSPVAAASSSTNTSQPTQQFVTGDPMSQTNNQTGSQSTQQPNQFDAFMEAPVGDVDLGGGGSQATSPNASAKAGAATVPVVVAAPSASSSVSSYFGGSDDPVSDVLGGIGGNTNDPFAAVPTVTGDANEIANNNSLGYFDNAGADDWMNPTPVMQLPSHITEQPQQPQANQFFDSFSQQPPAPQPPQPHIPEPTPNPLLRSESLPAQAPGGPIVNPQPTMPTTHIPPPVTSIPPVSTQPAPVDDYFSGSLAASDDWLSSVPLVDQPLQPVINAPTYPPTQSHFAPPINTRQPSLPDRQISELNEVDLNSPIKPPLTPSISDGGMAEVSLGSSNPPGNPYASSSSDRSFSGYPPQTDGPSRPAPVPFMPRTASLEPTPTNPYQNGPTSAATGASPYGAPTQPAVDINAYRPMPPVSSASEPHARTMPTPSTLSHQNSLSNLQPPPPNVFMPRAPEPTTQQPPMPSTHQPWQPQQTPPSQQQNGYPSTASMPSQYGAATPSSSYSDPNAAGGMFGTPNNMFNPSLQPPQSQGRVWTPPPAHPLVGFGFGGKLLTMIPRSAQTPGSIVIQPLSDLLESQSFVQKLTSFPGPLTLPQGAPGTKHPRHVELEDIVQNAADKALYASLPIDSPLYALACQQGQDTQGRAVNQQLLSNYRTSKRLLYLLLLESLKFSGKIHRGLNPASLNTLPGLPPSATGEKSLEDSMVQYLVQLDGHAKSASNSLDNGPWLDNAASSHGVASGSDALIPSPIRTQVHDPAELLEERKKQDQVLVSMQQLLMQGQRKEACNLAIEHRLWSHALLLASFDMSTYHMVVGKFATQQFSDGSPLQSLYSLFAQQPNILFRGIPGPDGKGVDGIVVPGPHLPLFTTPNTPPLMKNWRANLSILLANPTPNDKQVLTTLGDTLWQNYSLPHAAHMVYLLAGHSLGPDVPGSTLQHALPLGRILLIGSDHRKHMRTFVTPAALQRTEIFEYTKQLAAAAPVLPNTPPTPYGGLSPAFQLFKLLYAYQLAEIGLLTRALQYCDQLSNTVKVHGKTGGGTIAFPHVFLASLESLENRLRENLNAKTGPGLGTKIMGKLFNWMVGDGAKSAGTTTTVVGPDPTLGPPALKHSVSQNSIPSKVSPSLSSSTPLRPSTSDFDLGQQYQPQSSSYGGPLPQSYGGQPQHHASQHSLGGGDQIGALNPSSMHPPKHSRSVTEPHAGNSNTNKRPEASPKGDETPTEEKKKGGGLLSVFSGVFGRGKSKPGEKKPVQAILKNETTFEYDETLKEWVEKDKNGNIVKKEEEDKPVAPPTISEEMKARLSMAAPPASSPHGLPPSGTPATSPTGAPGLPGMPAPPSGMFGMRGGSTKGRYALQESSYEDTSAASAAPMHMLTPTPGLPSMYPTTPTTPGATNGGASAPPAFKVFRPSATAPSTDGSQPAYGAAPVPATTSPTANGSFGQPPSSNGPAPPIQQPSPYGAPPSQQPYGGGSAPMRASTPPHGAPSNSYPSHSYGAQPTGGNYPPSGPSGYAPPTDMRAASTPPMRPGAMPTGGGGYQSMPYLSHPPGGPTPPQPLNRYAPQPMMNGPPPPMPQPGMYPPMQPTNPYPTQPPPGSYRAPPPTY